MATELCTCCCVSGWAGWRAPRTSPFFGAATRATRGAVNARVPDIVQTGPRRAPGARHVPSCRKMFITAACTLVVAGLLAVTTVAQAGMTPSFRVAKVAAGETTQVPIEIAGEAENTVSFSTLRTTAEVVSISLIDPSGQTIWRREHTALRVVPRAQTRDPERGTRSPCLRFEMQSLGRGDWRSRQALAGTGRHWRASPTQFSSGSHSPCTLGLRRPSLASPFL